MRRAAAFALATGLALASGAAPSAAARETRAHATSAPAAGAALGAPARLAAFPAAAADTVPAAPADTSAAGRRFDPGVSMPAPAPDDSLTPAPAAPARAVAAPAAAVADTAARRGPGRWSKWEFGFRGAIGGSGFGGELGNEADGGLIAYDAGGFMSRRVGPLRVEPQLLIAARGARFKDRIFVAQDDGFGNITLVPAGVSERSLQIFYLETPLVLRVPVGPWFFEPHVAASAAPALMLTASYADQFGFFEFDSGDLQRFGWSWSAGLGTRWLTGWGALTVDLRYARGAGDAFDAGRGRPGENRAWLLGASFQQGRGGAKREEPRPRGRPW